MSHIRMCTFILDAETFLLRAPLRKLVDESNRRYSLSFSLQEGTSCFKGCFLEMRKYAYSTVGQAERRNLRVCESHCYSA